MSDMTPEKAQVCPYFQDDHFTLYCGDIRDLIPHLPRVDAIVTSPPYRGLRDYGVAGQIGNESVDEYIETLATVLTELGNQAIGRTGSLWLNLGDTYAKPSRATGRRGKDAAGVERPAVSRTCVCGTGFSGGIDQEFCSSRCGGSSNAKLTFPPKSHLMLPERVALAMLESGWTLRNKVVWHKTNAMPTSATDRLSNKWEHLFHMVLTRHWEPGYYYDLNSVKTDTGANPGDVWTIPTRPYKGAHFAVFPEALATRPILASVPEGGVVLDPFMGSGTVAVVARRLGRRAVGVELNPDYCEIAVRRYKEGASDGA